MSITKHRSNYPICFVPRLQDKSFHAEMSSEEKKGENIPQVKYQNQLKHMNENYDQHVDDYLPDRLHRGDIVSTSRLLGYTDAMMATCGTFLVIPIRNLKHMTTSQSLKEFIEESKTEFIMFFLGFLVVCTVWESINIKAMVIKRLDDIMVLGAVLAMLAACVLPFSLALQGHFPNEHVPIIMTCVTLALIEILDILKFFYSFASPRLLHLALHKWEKKDLRLFRNILLMQNVGNLLIILLGGLLALWDYKASWFIIGFLILMPLIRKLLFFVRRRYFRSHKCKSQAEKCQFWYHVTKGNISKERVEAFSDAAVAIIACVLILDITVEEFPKKADVKHHGLNSVLKHMTIEFYTFFSTYIIVSLLWYVNHTMLHLFHTVNVVILYLQKIFLAFTALTPLASNMFNKFIYKKNGDTAIAVRYSTSFTFAAAVCNVLMLAWAFHVREKVMHKWALASCIKANIRQHLYIFLKVLTIPFWCLICMFCSLGPPEYLPYISLTCLGGTVVTFIALKFAFLNHVGKSTGNREELHARFNSLGSKEKGSDNSEMYKGKVSEEEKREADEGNKLVSENEESESVDDKEESEVVNENTAL